MYAILSLKTFQGNISSIGLRQLATLIGKSRTTAQRAHYELTSEVFAQKQRAGVEEVISYPRKRLVSVKTA